MNPEAILNVMDPCDPANPADPADASINELYLQIKKNPCVLEEIDKKPFAETPLHTAASAGDIRLATEIIRLKPSFAWKLDGEGLSPMHHALQNRHYKMVRRFVSINKDLVRVKGKMGLTPLHQVAATAVDEEQTEILAEFLAACPDSVGDLTVAGETAMHIAVKGRKFEALQVLVGWLRRCSYYQPEFVDSILNWKNESGYTILHVSARNNDQQRVAFLIKNGIKLNVKDSEDKAHIKKLLNAANALPGDHVRKARNLADRLKKKITTVDVIAFKIERQRRSITDDTTRNALMAVAVLVATMTYQSALSPPGGFRSSPDSANSTSHTTSSIPAPAPAPAADGNWLGKSVMTDEIFYFFFTSNSITLLVSTVVINWLMPFGTWLSELVMPSVFIYFMNGYLVAMEVISPYDGLESVFRRLKVAIVIFYCSFPLMRAVVRKKLEHIRGTWEMESIPASGANRW